MSESEEMSVEEFRKRYLIEMTAAQKRILEAMKKDKRVNLRLGNRHSHHLPLGGPQPSMPATPPNDPSPPHTH